MGREVRQLFASHSTASQYVFTFDDAQAINIAGWKVPSFADQISIIPSDNSTAAGGNIFSKSGEFEFPQSAGGEVPDGCEGSGKGLFMKNGNGDYYAVRFFGEGSKASAWHYKWVSSPCKGLLIESYVLQDEIADVDAARTVLFSLPKSGEWSKSKNTEWSEAPGSSSSLVSRFLPACGYTANGSSGIADTGVGVDCYYWSSTESGTKAFSWHSTSSYMRGNFYAKTYGFGVRLFRANN